MFDFDYLKDLEKEIKSVEYVDHDLIITLMNDEKKVIVYSDDKLEEIRNDMLLTYTFNKKKYTRALDCVISYINNTKLISFLLLLGSIPFLYNLDIDVQNKILAGVSFATATLMYNLHKDNLKEKYMYIKLYLEKILYYIENRDAYRTDNNDELDNYVVNIEEVNKKGMTFRKLRNIGNQE